MDNEIKIVSTTESDLGWQFNVEVDGHEYLVTLTHDYYFMLTSGETTPEQLIERSFEFLLSREPVSSILPEFDLKLISTYFPEYETEITKF